MRAAGRKIRPLIVAAVYLLLAWVLMTLISHSGIYPAGADVMGHLYRGDFLYRAIRAGDLFPSYDPCWYNGIEPFRYHGPVSAYMLALCEAAAGGNVFGGYILYCGVIFAAGAFAFFAIASAKGRPYLGAALGVLWMLQPANLLLVFGEGDLARAFALVWLPVLVFFLEGFLREGRAYRLLAAAGILFLLIFTDHDLAVMAAIALTLYLLFYAAANHGWIRFGQVVLMLLGVFLLSGFWLVPYLTNRGTPADLTEEMAEAFQSGLRSIDPFVRSVEDVYLPYFGLAAFMLIIFGLLCADKKSTPAFGTGLLLFFGTTESAYLVLKMLPGNSHLWMLQYVPLAMCLLLYGLVCWRRLKYKVQIVICTLLLLDCLPSVPLFSGVMDSDPADRRFAAEEAEMLLDTAKRITVQRLALLDLGEMEADGMYLVNAYQVPLQGSFGADITAASTTYNITQLERAYSGGQFKYLFDRTLELGNDSVLLQLKHVAWNSDAIEELDAAAALSGYYLADANERWRLYHRDVDGNFGVVSHFGAIGIGSGAGQISLDFPTVEEVESTNINDYTYEELSKYQTVYLNGFTYSDKYAAEDMLIRLAENGTRIVLLADGIPQDPTTKAREFLGVHSQEVVFSNGYPELETEHFGTINTDLFARGHATWRTVYVTGLYKVYGYTQEDGVQLDFYGTVKNDNIYVLGINLTYHYALTRDPSIEALLYEIFHMEIGAMPERSPVPVQVEYGADTITVRTENADVDITLAAHDSFVLPEGTEVRNRLVHVTNGEALIRLQNPYLWKGLAVSAAGMVVQLLAVLLGGRLDRKWREEQKHAAEG
ncbi:MAG: hypothetical protein IJ600_09470 [Lachnospiraceae bacterium]|nr:hypothetical protein [Lachnospiraceae bacterium]